MFIQKDYKQNIYLCYKKLSHVKIYLFEYCMLLYLVYHDLFGLDWFLKVNDLIHIFYAVFRYWQTLSIGLPDILCWVHHYAVIRHMVYISNILTVFRYPYYR